MKLPSFSRLKKRLKHLTLFRLVTLALLLLSLLAAVGITASKKLNFDIRQKASGGNDSHSVVGFLDVADGRVIGGWAKDDDCPGKPIKVHVYIDGEIQDELVASIPREDVGNHSFHANLHPYGAGEHRVNVYGIGLDSNCQLSHDNPELQQSPQTFNTGCDNLFANTHAWCMQAPEYWQDRQKTTTRLINPDVLIGISETMGGTITQLYGKDRSRNIIEEHGGSAVQLSLYGADDINQSHLNYDHCEGTEGWPYNPIQAQSDSCGWSGSGNDIDEVRATNTSWSGVLKDPFNFSKSTQTGLSGLNFYQDVSLGPAYAKVDYRITYNGSMKLSYQRQEVPAIFTDYGINHSYCYSRSGQPHCTTEIAPSPVFPETDADRFVAFLNYDLAPVIPFDTTDQRWASVCDKEEKHCLTVYYASEYMQAFSIKKLGHAGAYMGAIGQFAIQPGMDIPLTIYLFPYKYDQQVQGKTVLEWINSLPKPIATPPPSPTAAPILEMSRAEAAQRIISEYDIVPYTPNTPSFADVPTDHPQFAAIEGIYRNGITIGCAENPLKFCPERLTTRADVAAFMLRAKGISINPEDTNPRFTDVSATHPLFPYVQRFGELSITKGCSSNPPQFCPERSLTGSDWDIFKGRLDYAVQRNPDLLNTDNARFSAPTTADEDATQTTEPTKTYDPADINQDGVVNTVDYDILLKDFSRKKPKNPRSDINKDGIINAFDYALLIKAM